jgi:hypothetical protein
MITVVGEDTGFGKWAIVTGEFDWNSKRWTIDEPVNLLVTPYPGRYPQIAYVLDIIDMALCIAGHFDAAFSMPENECDCMEYLDAINAKFTVRANGDEIMASCDRDWSGVS